MRHGWAALVTVLALTALMPRQLVAQQGSTPPQQEPSQPRQRTAPGSLGQNYPNPFNPETQIPFAVGDPPSCTEGARPHRVTLRIYNLLAQLVAVPVLKGGTGDVAGGAEIENLTLTCNQYIAYWDGKDRRTGREVASGIYLYRLEIDGKAIVKKMIVAK